MCILTPVHFGIKGILSHYFSHCTIIITIIMELKQQQRRWLQKHLLKSEFVLLRTLTLLFHLV